MKLVTSKINSVFVGILLMVVLSLAGCTKVTALAIDVVGGVDTATSISAQQKAWGPSYWRDDPALIEGITFPIGANEKRWGPSYWRDDPDLVSGRRISNH